MKKFISMLLSVIIAFLLPVRVFAATMRFEDIMTVSEMNEIHNQISELRSERSFLRMERNVQQDSDVSTMSTDSIDERIEEIDKELEELGVRRLSSEEFGADFQTRGIEVPNVSTETWDLYVYSSVYYEGVRYEVSVLTAESNGTTNSRLYNRDAKIIHAAPGIAAGTATYVRIFGTSISGTIGSVIGTIYDAISTTVSNLSTSTIIQNVSVNYDWQCDTIMHYVYVEEWGAEGDPQLCYVYNEVSGLVLGITSNVRFGGNDNKLNYEIYEKRSNRIMNENASLLSNAIKSYLNHYQVMHSFVEKFNVIGVGNNVVARQSLCVTVYPGLFYW